MLAKFKNCFVYHKDYFKDVKIDTPEELIKYPLILPSATSSIRTKLDEYMEHKNIIIFDSLNILKLFVFFHQVLFLILLSLLGLILSMFEYKWTHPV